MIENRLLHYFLAIAREQNISRAAETLHVTQSTLSKQMMDLEAQLGKQLFIRGNRKITLTDEGYFLRSKAQEILELVESTESAFSSDTQTLSGKISIACGETVAMDWLVSRFTSFHNQNPNVTLQIHSGDADTVMERLDKGLADIGLVLGPIKQERFHYMDIHKKDIFGLLMQADDPLAKQERISLMQLKTLPLILAEQTFSGHQQLELFGNEYNSLNVVATYNLIYNATYLVEHGVGYALCLERLVNTAGRNLTFRPVEPELFVDLFLVTKKYQTFSPAVKAYISALQNDIT